MLSNTVITETPTSGNKEGSESANVNFGAPADTTVQEKISVVHCNDEKPQLITAVKAEVPDTVIIAENETETGNEKETSHEKETKNENETVNENGTQFEKETDAEVEESVVLAIQTAVRVFLVVSLFYFFKYKTELIVAICTDFSSNYIPGSKSTAKAKKRC